MDPAPIVFVDVDGTLLEGAGSEARFIARLIARGELGLAQWLHAAAFVSRWGLRYREHTFKKNKAYLSGLDVERIRGLADAFVRDDLDKRLRTSVMRRIERHRRRGEVVALLTGTLDCIAAPLAARVGADLWCATHCARDDGIYGADPPDIHPFGVGKLRCARDICVDRGTDLSRCWAYADAIHDIPLLRGVGHPVAVDPDRALSKIAHDEGWEVLSDP